MKIEFEQIAEKAFPKFKGGEGNTNLKMYEDASGKIMRGRLEPGAFIGLHTHETNCEIVFIVEGEGKAVYDNQEELLKAGDCHYCPKGHAHSLINNSEQDLIFYAVVPELKE